MATPLPLMLEAESWAGNDGNWSVWPIEVGTPPQRFSVLPATSHGEIWVPLPEGCQQQPIFANASVCGASRGLGDFQGSQSSGYQTNSSSTWTEIGTYALPVQDGLFVDDEFGLYGNDTVVLHRETGSVEITGQSVAGIATKDFWLGSLGIAPRAANFTVESTIVRSLLDNLKHQNATPSDSFGLDVGASYDNAPGSLILGGFDENASSGRSISVTHMDDLELRVNARSIVLNNMPGGTVSMTHDLLSLPMVLDSTVSQLWLPRVVCDAMEDALGLTFDTVSELYLVNDTARQALIELDPTFTFKLAADSTSNETTTITLPYPAFDLQIGPPTYDFNFHYFPIRRARKGSVLGRAFLQGAYLVVDWERSNFTIGPIAHHRTKSIVSIPSHIEASQSHPLSTGAIVGIAIGATALIIAMVAIIWWRLHARRKRKQAAAAELERPLSPYTEDKKIAEEGCSPMEALRNSIHSEAMSFPVYELDREQICQPERFELATNTAVLELEAKQEVPGKQAEQPLLQARCVEEGSEASRV